MKTAFEAAARSLTATVALVMAFWIQSAKIARKAAVAVAKAAKKTATEEIVIRLSVSPAKWR